ncbi:YeeE/YedE family protein [Aurantimonas sp. HBX-1]|uniref:YeeE/YedE family protein n=1 Tax=Aurantimonas sp. HBX-1 TaxID=2906072 RepID=UPI001F465F73|nr:YeeE/YedE thiosulfate transporter family protein [Aurantimonas sp. HBX-1]UIJ70476.1 YeeE/YedE family protein [Aurantimonas sp. HBX-1]
MPLDTITSFTPLASLAGGILLGLAAVMVMALFGRIAGISGITTGAVPGRRDDWSWRLAFLAGLVAAPLLVLAVTGSPVQQTVPGNLAAMAIAGLLVGFGTITGSGCTSGHGVCGLARLSARSLVAVVTFMATAAATVFVLRHLV